MAAASKAASYEIHEMTMTSMVLIKDREVPSMTALLDALEERLILAALVTCGRSVTGTARLLSLNRTTLQMKMRKLGITREATVQPRVPETVTEMEKYREMDAREAMQGLYTPW